MSNTIGLPDYVRFKDGLVPTDYEALHPVTKKIFLMACSILDQCGWDVEITSMVRPAGSIPGESGVHATGRAIDFVPKLRPASVRFGQREGSLIAAVCNLAFRRNDQKFSLLYHNVGLGAHFHAQAQSTGDYTDLKGFVPKKV